ncbi:MAG: histidine phosphatase family protein [Pseudomonadota bacterium]
MPGKTTIIVMRHGESEANSRQIISDKLVDHPLTDRGLEQARRAALSLKDEPIDLIITSTRQRARLTGEEVNKLHGVQVLETEDLIERNYGIFSGIPDREAHEIMEKQGFSWLNIPESESVEALDARVKRVVTSVTNLHASHHALIVTHADVVRAFFRVFRNVPPEESVKLRIENSKPYIFEVSDA